jgi:hypothetical protein
MNVTTSCGNRYETRKISTAESVPGIQMGKDELPLTMVLKF